MAETWIDAAVVCLGTSTLRPSWATVNRARRGQQESKQSVDCAEALKRAALPASRRTFAVVVCRILSARSSCCRGHCPQPADQRPDFLEYQSWHRDLGPLDGDT